MNVFHNPIGNLSQKDWVISMKSPSAIYRAEGLFIHFLK